MKLEKQSWWERRTLSLSSAMSILYGYADMEDGEERASILQSIEDLQWVKDNPASPVGAIPGNDLESSIKEHGPFLYEALETIVRQNAGGNPVGHDAIIEARRVLASASKRRGKRIDWTKEHLGVKVCAMELGVDL